MSVKRGASDPSDARRRPAVPKPEGDRGCVRFMFGTYAAQTLAAGRCRSCAWRCADNNVEQRGDRGFNFATERTFA